MASTLSHCTELQIKTDHNPDYHRHSAVVCMPVLFLFFPKAMAFTIVSHNRAKVYSFEEFCM